MATTTTVCTSFKKEILEGVHESTDTYKIALIKGGAAGSYGAGTTNYSNLTDNSDEVASGSGYTTGGATLSGFSTGTDDTTAYLDFTSDPSWAAATFSTIGAIIYNSSQSNKAVAVLDFGGTFSPSNGSFTITFPAPGATALIRLT
jgi:hypothetical protein